MASDVLICPDCGGVLGATETTDAGAPCTCFAPAPKAAAPAKKAAGNYDLIDSVGDDPFELVPGVSKSDTDALGTELGPDTSAPAGEEPPKKVSQPKICVVCGKDTAGHRRMKDSRGYICYDCAKEERRKERGDRVKCQSCGRAVKESVVVEYAGLKLCPECHNERQKLAKQQMKRAGISNVQSSYEKKRLYTMLGVAGFLLLIIILNKFGLLPKFF